MSKAKFFWNLNRQATLGLQSWSFNSCMLAYTNDTDHPLVDRFSTFIQLPEFPCLGAKAALSRGFLQTVVARDITSAWDDLRIYSGLFNLSDNYRRNPRPFQSFAVLFEGPSRLSERQFEEALWARVQSLTEKDAFHGQPYDRRVSSNPDNPHFSLSFGSEAFFIVGLHPNASRASRRFERPVLVFNLHDQFEQLRDWANTRNCAPRSLKETWLRQGRQIRCLPTMAKAQRRGSTVDALLRTIGDVLSGPTAEPFTNDD